MSEGKLVVQVVVFRSAKGEKRAGVYVIRGRGLKVTDSDSVRAQGMQSAPTPTSKPNRPNNYAKFVSETTDLPPQFEYNEIQPQPLKENRCSVLQAGLRP